MVAEEQLQVPEEWLETSEEPAAPVARPQPAGEMDLSQQLRGNIPFVLVKGPNDLCVEVSFLCLQGNALRHGTAKHYLVYQKKKKKAVMTDNLYKYGVLLKITDGKLDA